MWGYIKKLLDGLLLTFQHLLKFNQRKASLSIQDDKYFNVTEGLVTIKYPKEKIPVPDIGRYQLHLDIEDCIGCDQCARICPVNCIEIETIRSVEDLGFTSDGTKKKLYLPKFDIDMAKCCFCGLCTVVCPTECLVMTSEYDYSTQKISEMTFHWRDIEPEEAIKKQKEWEEYELAKKQAKLNAIASEEKSKSENNEKKPVFKIKPKTNNSNSTNEIK